MNWQEFEEELKSHVAGQETPVDTDALWASIRRKKRRRMLLFWWFFGGICLLGGMFWFAQGKGDGDEMLKRNANEAVVEIRRAPQASNETFTTQKDAPSAGAPDKQHTTAYAEQNAVPETAPSQQRTTTSPQKNMRSTAGEDDRESPRKNKFRQPQPATRVYDACATTAGTVVLDMPPSFANNSDSLLLIFAQAETGKKEKDFSGKDSLVWNSTKSRTKTFAPPTVAVLPVPSAPVRSEAEQVLDLLFIMPAPTLIAPPPPDRPTFQIGVQAGVAVWGKIKNNAADPLPRSGERLLEATQLGIHFQKPIGKRWAFRAGIQYQQYNSVFNWQNTVLKTNVEQLVLNYYSDGRVDSSYLPGALVERTRNVRHHNQNTTLGIPLDLQFSIPLRRMVWTPFAGVQPMFLQTRSGVILDEQNRPDYALYTNVYERSFGLGLRAGVSLEFPLRKNFSFLIEPAGGIDLTPRTAKTGFGSERFWQFGINIGIVRSL